MNNKSPLRYPGGKTRACKLLDAIVAKHFPLNSVDTIISPFFGGGSFEFYLQNKYGFHIIANDKFKPLFNFWKTCKLNKQDLCKELMRIQGAISKEDFKNYRDIIMNETDQLRQAVLYFVINRCSFSGATLSGGFSEQAAKTRFTESSIDRVEALDLSKYEISNKDFKDFIESTSHYKNSLLFLDPPYYLGAQSKLYGKNGDLHEGFDHEKLYQLLSKSAGSWILTYNNCDWIKKKYADFIILKDVSWSYGMNKSKESSEVVIIKPS